MTDGARAPEDETPPSDRTPPARGVRVPVADLLPGQTRVFTFDEDGWEQSAFVVHHEGALRVFVNRCPHVPYTLDFGDGELMSPDRRTLVCANHGARFDPATGRCTAGPPIGRALTALAFTRDGDDVMVDVAPHTDGI